MAGWSLRRLGAALEEARANQPPTSGRIVALKTTTKKLHAIQQRILTPANATPSRRFTLDFANKYSEYFHCSLTSISTHRIHNGGHAHVTTQRFLAGQGPAPSS